MLPEERKTKTEQLLHARGLPIHEALPVIESEGEAQLREPSEVACRILGLVSVVAAASGVDKPNIIGFLQDEVLWDVLSPLEKKFLETQNSSDEKNDEFRWRTEAVWLLLWAMGLVEDLGWPTGECDEDKIIALVPCTGAPTDAFVENAALRPLSEILDASDLIYRIHWASRHLEGQGADCAIDPDVVLEWHTAINWLTVYDEADWDDVITDT